MGGAVGLEVKERRWNVSEGIIKLYLTGVGVVARTGRKLARSGGYTRLGYTIRGKCRARAWADDVRDRDLEVRVISSHCSGTL
jgi:hypothetical protein